MNSANYNINGDRINQKHSNNNETEIALDKISAKRADILSVIDKASKYQTKLSSLFDDKPSDIAVKKAITAYINEEYDNRLKALAIDSLKENHVGIKISALKSAGYNSVYSIKDISYSQLTNIYGIGEKGAKLICHEVSLLCQQTKASIKVEPDFFNNNGIDIVLEYYRYKSWGIVYAEMASRLSLEYKFICESIRELNAYSSKVSCIFASKTKKTEIYRNAQQLSATLTDELWHKIDNYLAQRDTINKTQNSTIKNEYTVYKDSYLREIKKIQMATANAQQHN